MKMLNRAVLIVRAKQPYLGWAADVDDSGLEPDPDDDKTVYLIPPCEGDEEAKEILKNIYAEIFERELWAWHTEEQAWPQDRDFKMFQEWFDVEFHSVVEDLCDYEIEDGDDQLSDSGN
jgi:hypothetical protein